MTPLGCGAHAAVVHMYIKIAVFEVIRVDFVPPTSANQNTKTYFAQSIAVHLVSAHLVVQVC